MFRKIYTRLKWHFETDGLNALVIIWENYLSIALRRYYYRFLFGWDMRSITGTPCIRGSKHIKIGANFCCRRSLWLEAVTNFGGTIYSPKIVIGDNFSASDSLHIAATTLINIGDDVLIGSNVLITDHLHGDYSGASQSPASMPPSSRPLTDGKSVKIENNVFIGDNVCILPGASIGFGSVIGANSTVISEIPAKCIAVGSPAVVIKRYSELTNKWERV